MTTKTTKNAKAKNAAAANNVVLPNAQAAQARFTEQHEAMSAKVELLIAVDLSKKSEDEKEAHKAELLAAKNRAERAKEFAAALNTPAFAQAFDEFALTYDAVTKLQIYAQDKLLATMKAIAANCALSSVRAGNHSNMMTQRLVRVLDADKKVTVSNAPRRMHDLFPDKSMGTYSAQASSSRQVLELLGMLSFDAMTKEFSLSERGETYRAVIAH